MYIYIYIYIYLYIYIYIFMFEGGVYCRVSLLVMGLLKA